MTAALYGKLTLFSWFSPSLWNSECPANAGHLPFRGRRAKLPGSSANLRGSIRRQYERRIQPGVASDLFRSALRRHSTRRRCVGAAIATTANGWVVGTGCATPPAQRPRRKMSTNLYEGDPDRQCSGKLAFPNKSAAKLKIRRMRNTRSGKANLRVYRCPHCRSFHIGTKLGRK